MTKFCPDCGKELINENAVICPNCGGALKKISQGGERNPAVAAILSFLICGLGQLYNGQGLKALIYFIISVVFFGLLFVIVGIILLPIWWIIGIIDAYKSAKLLNDGEDASKFINIS